MNTSMKALIAITAIIAQKIAFFIFGKPPYILVTDIIEIRFEYRAFRMKLLALYSE